MNVTGVIFLEKTTPTITGYFKDNNDNAISIEELYLTVYDSKTKEIINSRDISAITISDYVNGTTGYLSYPINVAETTIIRSGTKPNDIVEHVFRFDYKWQSLTRQNSTTIAIKIKNLDHK